MEISLIGFMATGKSTAGKLLSDKLKLLFLETDSLIEKRTGMSILEIFSQKGEQFFRKKEKEILENVIDKKRDYVLSTGGGIVLSRENRKLLKKNTFPVLLTASPQVIFQRIQSAEERRPLLETDNPLGEIKKLLKKRKDYYNQFENKIDTNQKSPEEIVNIIVSMTGVNSR